MATYSMLSVQMALFLALSCTSITHKAASFTFNRGITSLATTRVAAKTARYAVTKEAVEIWRQKAGFGTVKVQDNSNNDATSSSNKEASTTLITAATAAADIANEEHQTKVVQAVQTDDDNSNNSSSEEEEEERYMPPWSLATQRAPSSKAFARFRQHVNPLSRRFQMPTDLPENWPYSDFTNVNLPLYLDIGCGKGGFLLELVGRRHGNVYADGTDTYMNNTRLFTDTTDEWLPSTMNYLGLEIRPGVSQYAQNRVEKRGLSGKLSFVGCNANVDLDRLLSLYTESAETEVVDDGAIGDGESNNELKFVSIQFPDPHFKKSHTKRRVVTPALVTTLAKFMNQGGVVFLQSDIKEALEAMREKFVEDDGLVYFDEHCDDDDCKIDVGSEEEYGLANPLGIPTEREVSVLNQDLPIYRTLFLRNDVSYPSKSSDLARNL